MAALPVTVAEDGQRLDQQAPNVQQTFYDVYGSRAAEQWVAEHNTAIGAGAGAGAGSGGTGTGTAGEKPNTKEGFPKDGTTTTTTTTTGTGGTPAAAPGLAQGASTPFGSITGEAPLGLGLGWHQELLNRLKERIDSTGNLYQINPTTGAIELVTDASGAPVKSEKARQQAVVEALSIANVTGKYEGLPTEAARQFDSVQAQRESEFARTFGEQARQFNATFGLQQQQQAFAQQQAYAQLASNPRNYIEAAMLSQRTGLNGLAPNNQVTPTTPFTAPGATAATGAAGAAGQNQPLFSQTGQLTGGTTYASAFLNGQMPDPNNAEGIAELEWYIANGAITPTAAGWEWLKNAGGRASQAYTELKQTAPQVHPETQAQAQAQTQAQVQRGVPGGEDHVGTLELPGGGVMHLFRNQFTAPGGESAIPVTAAGASLMGQKPIASTGNFNATGGWAAQDAVRQNVNPNQWLNRDYQNLSEDEKAGARALASTAGFSDSQTEHAIAGSKPKFTAPGYGGVRV